MWKGKVAEVSLKRHLNLKDTPSNNFPILLPFRGKSLITQIRSPVRHEPTYYERTPFLSFILCFATSSPINL